MGEWKLADCQSMLNFDFSSSDVQAESAGLSQYELGRCEASSIYRKQIMQEIESYETRIRAYEEQLKELELKRVHEVANLVKIRCLDLQQRWSSDSEIKFPRNTK